MTINDDFVLNALLQHNYLPNQSFHKDEFPPIFSSVSFSEDAATRVASEKARSSKPYSGYDSVSYKLTRFNNISRALAVPHPKAYVDLSFRIKTSWANISHITENPSSLLKFRKHRDGRLVVMNYDRGPQNSLRHLQLSFNRRFLAKADIANFYPSIYSHAVPWALVGIPAAKAAQSKGNIWYNRLDKAIRYTQRNETQGVAIGPATSNIISELILYSVDAELSQHYLYRRFTDDYTAYCKSDEEASSFIIDLENALSKYNLKLGPRKTSITALPAPADEPWIAELTMARPLGKNVSSYHASRFLSLAVELGKKYKEGSVLKYALRSLPASDLDAGGRITVLQYALNLAAHNPIVLPVIRTLLDEVVSDSSSATDYGEMVNALILRHSKLGRSDAVAWGLFYCLKYSWDILPKVAEEVLSRKDCIPTLLLYLGGERCWKDKVVAHAEDLSVGDLYSRDRYWLLLYQLFLDGRIKQPYDGDRTFEILQDEGVDFVEA